jgi:transposase
MARNWCIANEIEAIKRAAGRRRYNAVRQFRAAYRRRKVAELLMGTGLKHGCQAEVARQLGVSEATISRDVRRLREAELTINPYSPQRKQGSRTTSMP